MTEPFSTFVTPDEMQCSRQPACCTEVDCRRKMPYLLRKGWLTDRVYLITRYRRSSRAEGLIEASEKHDITEQFEAFALSEGWTPPPPVGNGGAA